MLVVSYKNTSAFNLTKCAEWYRWDIVKNTVKLLSSTCTTLLPPVHGVACRSADCRKINKCYRKL